MIRIGIDFSLTSPAICVYKNGKYNFISFFNDGGKDWRKSKSKNYKYHNDLCKIIDVIPYTRQIDDSNYRYEQKTTYNANILYFRKKGTPNGVPCDSIYFLVVTDLALDQEE